MVTTQWEAEQRWRALKESYPDSVVFHEADGLFVVRGRDVAVLGEEFGIKSQSAWLGFAEDEALVRMVELVNRGYDVLRASGRHVARLRRRNGTGKGIRRHRSESKVLAVEPTLVFDRGEIERATRERRLQKCGYEELLEMFKTALRAGEPLGEYGELYVYQVGEWYEVDWGLSSMVKSHALLLAKAALAAGRSLPCRLLGPRSRRDGGSRQPCRWVALAGQRLGQLTFDDVKPVRAWSRMLEVYA